MIEGFGCLIEHFEIVNMIVVISSDYTIVDGDLVISRVRPEDAGTYVCHAENENGRSDTPVSLSVGDLVPRFQQDPKSYISYQPMNDVYLDFDILLSLKPESTEGWTSHCL